MIGIVGVQVPPPSADRGMPPTCTAARRTLPSAVAVKARTPKGGPPANHSPRPATLSKPFSRATCPLARMRRSTAFSISPPKTMAPTEVSDWSQRSVVATLDHPPLASRLQISCLSTTARHPPPLSRTKAETRWPMSSVGPLPVAVNRRHPKPVATRIPFMRPGL